MWEINITSECEAWYDALSVEEQEPIDDAVDYLAEHGPAARRPVVGEIKGSAFDPRMKELIATLPGGREVRILFIFDPRREAVLLVGGDKSGAWKSWYQETIGQADELYRQYLHDIGEEA